MARPILSHVGIVQHGLTVMMICAAKDAKNKNDVSARKQLLTDSLGMDALADGWVGSMDVIMVRAWMHWPMDGLVAWTLSCFGHGCTGQWMGWQHAHSTMQT